MTKTARRIIEEEIMTKIMTEIKTPGTEAMIKEETETMRNVENTRETRGETRITIEDADMIERRRDIIIKIEIEVMIGTNIMIETDLDIMIEGDIIEDMINTL